MHIAGALSWSTWACPRGAAHAGGGGERVRRGAAAAPAGRAHAGGLVPRLAGDHRRQPQGGGVRVHVLPAVPAPPRPRLRRARSRPRPGRHRRSVLRHDRAARLAGEKLAVPRHDPPSPGTSTWCHAGLPSASTWPPPPGDMPGASHDVPGSASSLYGERDARERRHPHGQSANAHRDADAARGRARSSADPGSARAHPTRGHSARLASTWWSAPRHSMPSARCMPTTLRR